MSEKLPKRSSLVADRRRRRERGSDARPERGGYGSGLGCLMTSAAIVLFCASCYAAASLFTGWTGALGDITKRSLTSILGGAVIVPLLFVMYFCLSMILRRRIPYLMRTIVGCLLLYLCHSLLLGLINLAYGVSPKSALLVPGIFGWLAAVSLFEHTGPLGTALCTLAIAAVTLLCFGIRSHTDAVMSIFARLSEIFSPKSRGRHEAEESQEPPADAPVQEAAPIDEEAQPEQTAEDPDEALRERSRQMIEEARARTASAQDKIEQEDAQAISPQAEPEAHSEPPRDPNEPSPAFAASDFVLSRTRPEHHADEIAIPEPVRFDPPRAEEPAPPAVQIDRPPLPDTPRAASEKIADDIDAGSFEGIFPPPVELFGPEDLTSDKTTVDDARPLGLRIISSLEQFGIEADLAEILIGPTVIQFRIQPKPGVKVGKIVALSNDLALNLAVTSLRIEAPIPGMPYVGIEIPNPKREPITLRSLIASPEFQNADRPLPLPMGVTINGDCLVADLESMPHLLVAGTTGSGKSVFVNSCIVGLCSARTPSEMRMLMIDPKRVEMAVYDTLPHLLTPPVTDPKKAVHALGWAVREMERRYDLCAAVKVRSITTYNETVLPKDRLSRIVIVVDEFADLMMTASKEVEEYICRIAQKARAVGIHLILATQRPSVDVITGLIKANVPVRVAFTVSQSVDSRTIIDMGGAEKLLGRGDMLFLSTRSPKPIRIQSPWIDERAIMSWLDHLVRVFGEPDLVDIESQGGAQGVGDDSGMYDDDLFEQAVRMVLSSGMASASGLQRRLRIGFTRAGRLVDMMEAAGIIGPKEEGSKPRDILVDEAEAEEIIARIRG